MLVRQTVLLCRRATNHDSNSTTTSTSASRRLFHPFRPRPPGVRCSAVTALPGASRGHSKVTRLGDTNST